MELLGWLRVKPETNDFGIQAIYDPEKRWRWCGDLVLF